MACNSLQRSPKRWRRALRGQALLCAAAVLLCELISRPFAEMGICDDWSYILTAQKLAITGHIAYNGWATAMLGWQLYLGAAFVKLFGVSFTAPRMSTLLVATLTAGLTQRTLVRAGLTSRNATLATLAFVLSPLYLLLSVTFMSDIFGLFADIVCLYACLRALQAAAGRASAGWICLAVLANAVCGSARQIAWLGLLVMVPCTLWLLRRHRAVLLTGSAATVAGVLAVRAMLHWFRRQPYALPAGALIATVPPAEILSRVLRQLLDMPFLMLPVLAIFLPEVRRSSRRVLALLAAALAAYLWLIFQWHGPDPNPWLEPTISDWLSEWGGVVSVLIKGWQPMFFSFPVRLLMTVATMASLLCLIASIVHRGAGPTADANDSPHPAISPGQLNFVLLPFAFCYGVLLLSRVGMGAFDRYLLVPILIALVYLVGFYQQRIRAELPVAVPVLVAVFAVAGIAIVHNVFSLDRARIAIAAELHSAGIDDLNIDGGWEQDAWTQLQHADHVNDDRLPGYKPVPQSGPCRRDWASLSPLVQPRYAISFDPNQCFGPAPFPPVTYSRWLAATPGTLYVVHSIPPRPSAPR